MTVSSSLAPSSSPGSAASVINPSPILLSSSATTSAAATSTSSTTSHPAPPHHPAPHHPLSVRMAVTSAVVRPPGGSPSAVASVSPASQSGGPPTAPQPAGSGPGATPGRCCDTGRPIFTDPITGQTVCSCQYELLGGYQRLGALPTAALSMYSAPYAAAAAAAASEGMAAYFPGLGAEQAPFYTPTVSRTLQSLFFFYLCP